MSTLSVLEVLTVGGTSMGWAERMKVAAAICSEHARTRPVVCVVSAMSKVTDLLLDSLRKAEAGDRADLDLNLRMLHDRHVAACHDLLPSEAACAAVLRETDVLLSEFARIANGILMLGERP